MREHTHHDTPAACEEAECRSGKRNHYFRGKALGKEAFGIEQAYFIDRRRLINRAVHGSGVVFGFALELRDRKLTAGTGLGFDDGGREVFLARGQEVDPSNTLLLSHQNGKCCLDRNATLHAGRYVLAIHYAERPLESVRLSAGCGCDETQHNYICESPVFSLRPVEECCPCGESECPECDCCPDACGSRGRGPHSCLCQWLTSLDLSDAGAALCEWRGQKVAVCERVDLACVTIDRSDDECRPWYFRCIDDACGPRRLVKRNDLLYDLLRGCDLTRIEWFSWNPWHRDVKPVSWQAFKDRLNPASGAPEDRFAVRFSGPVLTESVTPDCFSMTVMFPVEDTGWQSVYRAPIVDVICAKPDDDCDPSNTTRTVTLVFDRSWFEDEFGESRRSKFRDGPSTVELRVFGGLLRSCSGQQVDADGNDTPGGTLLSVFRVQRST